MPVQRQRSLGGRKGGNLEQEELSRFFVPPKPPAKAPASSPPASPTGLARARARAAAALAGPHARCALQAATGLFLLNLAILRAGDGVDARAALASARAARGGAAGTGPSASSALAGDGAVTIVAACKGKHDTLPAAADSWLQVRGVSRVVLVDWTSTPAYADALPPHVLADARFRLVRVDGQATYTLTWANNLAAARAAPGQRLLKLDCDTVVTSDFVEAHPPAGRGVYSSDWAAARDENEVHLNGVFFAPPGAFAAVGGYDGKCERIQSYGWDDTDLKARLNASGYPALPMDGDRIHHLFHAAAARTAHVPALTPSAHFETSLNRLISERLPPWGAAARGAAYDLGPHAAYPRALRGALRPGTAVASQRAQISAEALAEVTTEAAYEALTHIPGFAWHESWHKVAARGPAYLQRLVASYHRADDAAAAPARRMLVVDLMHGMGNRLRALSSAAVVARASGHWLRVVARRDAHFGAELGDLLDLEASGLRDVWADFEEGELDLFPYDRYDYMDPSVKGAPVGARPGGSLSHVYARSAYRLASPLTGWEAEAAALRALAPARAVAEKAGRVALPAGRPLVSVHVRFTDPAEELEGLERSEYPEQGWADMTAAREKCSPPVFIAEMLKIKAAAPDTVFYAAADKPEALAALKAALPPGDVVSLDSGGCADRSAACLQFALADLLLLGKGGALLGSTWSSYSEVAGCFAGVKPRYAGEDF